MAVGPLQEILARLGTVKNPVLFTSSGFSISVMYFSKDFVLAANLIVILTGALMYLLAVGVFLTGLWFYIYAFLRPARRAVRQVELRQIRHSVRRPEDERGDLLRVAVGELADCWAPRTRPLTTANAWRTSAASRGSPPFP